MQTNAKSRCAGRPLGAAANSVLEYLHDSAAPARNLAAALKLPPRKIDRLLSRLVVGGRIEVIELQRHPGARRPVAVYGPPRTVNASPIWWLPSGARTCAVADGAHIFQPNAS